MINEVLNAVLDPIPRIDPRKSPRFNAEVQNTSILDSESEYNIYSTTPKIREPPNTYLKSRAITEAMPRSATLVV